MTNILIYFYGKFKEPPMRFVIGDLTHFLSELAEAISIHRKKRIGRFEAVKVLKTCELKTKQEQRSEIFYRDLRPIAEFNELKDGDHLYVSFKPENHHPKVKNTSRLVETDIFSFRDKLSKIKYPLESYLKDQLLPLAKELDKVLKKNSTIKKLGSPKDKNKKFSEQFQPREKFPHPMITFDSLSQSGEKNQPGENNGQQQQQEGGWKDFVKQILPRLKNTKTSAGSGQDTTSFPSKIKDDLNQDKENSQIYTESMENRGFNARQKIQEKKKKYNFQLVSKRVF